MASPFTFTQNWNDDFVMLSLLYINTQWHDVSSLLYKYDEPVIIYGISLNSIGYDDICQASFNVLMVFCHWN